MHLKPLKAILLVISTSFILSSCRLPQELPIPTSIPRTPLAISPQTNNTSANKQRAPKNWSIGILKGQTLLTLAELPSCPNPRFTARDIAHSDVEFVADPFLIHSNNLWHLFFESFNSKRQKGEISLATSADLCSWSYRGVVLSESWHLSYPFVFEDKGRFYMIPESRQAGIIQLYSAQHFPDSWRPERVLIHGEYSDPSLLFYGNRWWIFANVAPYGSAIFSAASLKDRFIEHRISPLYLGDPSRSRPAGRPVVVDGAVYRFVQDNTAGYGRAVRLMRVTRLDEEGFEEVPVADRDPFLSASGVGWNGFGMHHVSAKRLSDGSWVAAVDGNALDK